MALTRVQPTGRFWAASAASVSLTFSVPPALGNGLVVLVIGWKTGGPAFPSTGCTDNRGHTYLRAVTRDNATGENGAAIYYLPIVTTSAGPFTITVTTSGGTYFESAAVEVGGVGTGLTVDQVSSQTGSAASVTTGASPAVAAAEVFVAACQAVSLNQASITAEVLSPVWTQEFENLSYSSTIAGEGDTRVRSDAAGTTQIGNWTNASAGQYAAVLAAFRAPAAAIAVETVQPFVWGPL